MTGKPELSERPALSLRRFIDGMMNLASLDYEDRIRCVNNWSISDFVDFCPVWCANRECKMYLFRVHFPYCYKNWLLFCQYWAKTEKRMVIATVWDHFSTIVILLNIVHYFSTNLNWSNKYTSCLTLETEPQKMRTCSYRIPLIWAK